MEFVTRLSNTVCLEYLVCFAPDFGSFCFFKVKDKNNMIKYLNGDFTWELVTGTVSTEAPQGGSASKKKASRLKKQEGNKLPALPEEQLAWYRNNAADLVKIMNSANALVSTFSHLNSLISVQQEIGHIKVDGSYYLWNHLLLAEWKTNKAVGKKFAHFVG